LRQVACTLQNYRLEYYGVIVYKIDIALFLNQTTREIYSLNHETLYIKRLGNEYIKIKVISDNITQSKITSAYILTGCVTHFCTRHS
jgi:hypothetical protein